MTQAGRYHRFSQTPTLLPADVVSKVARLDGGK